ncbi:HAMP domain-containing histidine kinase [Facklamia sp. DSM 111018]|uniref:histidine kinase n=1 Tax=Facklamia lactis TaxID=2749967 RepID=A0ABS0LQE5_9LACT|nr:HAMP domain-containing sensor histidine kinase [Facklamia lactis]MBG9979729.1 HAMP domain-containing histidine kinase [Facklamia lactis]MBG9985591.1 HAMP domain-containing histidine kinase [Facklamia lactis]
MVYFLLVIILMLLIYLFLYRKQVQHIDQELKEIQKKEYTNQMISQEIHSQELDHLITSINQTIEKERQLRIQLIKHNELTKQLMTNLSHDIRTPLTSLSGFIQLLEENQDADKQARYFEIIHQRLAHLNDMVNDLFLYMKLNNLEVSHELTPIDWNEFIKQQLISYYDLLTSQNIQLEMKLPENPAWILANYQLLVRVHDNILNNIIKHHGNNIVLELQIIKDYALLKVTNDIIIQSEEHSTHSNNNSGLGLAIIQTAIDKMKGQVEIREETDQFSIMITLPIQANKIS